MTQEEILSTKDQLADLYARAPTDKNARSQLIRLYKQFQQPVYSHRTHAKHEEIQRRIAQQTPHRGKSAKALQKDSLLRSTAQATYPHTDTRGVFAALVSPDQKYFRVDYYNDKPLLTAIQLYQLPSLIQRSQRLLFWIEQKFRQNIQSYLQSSIARSFRMSPMHLMNIYNTHIAPKLTDLETHMRDGQYPLDTYQQGLELCAAEHVPFPITNQAVVDIVDAGVINFTFLRLLIEKAAQIENTMTEWDRSLLDTDPGLKMYSGPTWDANRVEQQMAQLYEKHRYFHMDQADRTLQAARSQGTQQVYAHRTSNEDLVFDGVLPRRGASTTRPGYSTDFPDHQYASANTPPLDDIYKTMRK
jgi:hypothetical protein